MCVWLILCCLPEQSIKENNKMAMLVSPCTHTHTHWYETVWMYVWFPRVAVKVVFHQDESQRCGARHFLLFMKGRIKSALMWDQSSSSCFTACVTLTVGEGIRSSAIAFISSPLHLRIEGKACSWIKNRYSPSKKLWCTTLYPGCCDATGTMLLRGSLFYTFSDL